MVYLPIERFASYRPPRTFIFPSTIAVRFNAALVLEVLRECACHQLAVSCLQQLIQENGGLCQLRLNAIQVETLAISSAISAVATYVGHGTRGPGSTTSENHIMCELWAPILSNAVKLAPNRLCLPLWECDYMFPQNAGLGSSRSDFVAMTIATDEEPLPFLITEFEANGVRVHKDYLVAVSEATLQLNSIVSRFCCGPEDLSKVRCFVALASDSSISFRVISPEVDNQAGGRIFYRETDCGRTFRLAQHDLSARIVDAVLLGIFNRCWDTSVDVAAWHEHSF